MRNRIRSGIELVGERPGAIALALLAAGAILAGLAIAEGSGGLADASQDGDGKQAIATEGSGGLADASQDGDGKQAIATATSNGWRVKLVALRDRSERPPLADARLSAFKRTGGRWDRLGRPRLVGARGGWFWRVVTRRFGVFELALRTGRDEHPIDVKVRLLESASLGPSAPFRFVVAAGRLRPVDV